MYIRHAPITHSAIAADLPRPHRAPLIPLIATECGFDDVAPTAGWTVRAPRDEGHIA